MDHSTELVLKDAAVFLIRPCCVTLVHLSFPQPQLSTLGGCGRKNLSFAKAECLAIVPCLGTETQDPGSGGVGGDETLNHSATLLVGPGCG